MGNPYAAIMLYTPFSGEVMAVLFSFALISPHLPLISQTTTPCCKLVKINDFSNVARLDLCDIIDPNSEV